MEVKRDTAPCDKDSQLKNQMNLKPVSRETIWFVDKMGIHAAGYVFTCSVYLYHSISRLSSLARIHLNPNESSWFTLIYVDLPSLSMILRSESHDQGRGRQSERRSRSRGRDARRSRSRRRSWNRRNEKCTANLGCFKVASLLQIYFMFQQICNCCLMLPVHSAVYLEKCLRILCNWLRSFSEHAAGYFVFNALARKFLDRSEEQPNNTEVWSSMWWNLQHGWIVAE